MTRRYGLIFDVDGVIADSEDVNARATAQAMADLLGVPGLVRADFAAGVGRGAESYVQVGARSRGLELDGETLSRVTAQRQANILKLMRAEGLPTFPGVHDLMRAALARPDFGVAVATSSDREVSHAMLEATGAPYAGAAYVTGSEIANRKPAPDLFLAAVARLGLKPARCLVVEDAPSGVAAAKAAGCRCVAVTNTTPAAELAQADQVIESLAGWTPDTVAAFIDR